MTNQECKNYRKEIKEDFQILGKLSVVFYVLKLCWNWEGWEKGNTKENTFTLMKIGCSAALAALHLSQLGRRAS